MRRRDILAGAGSLAAGATLSFPAPAIGQAIRQLKMVTDWPEGTPGLHTSAVRFAHPRGASIDAYRRVLRATPEFDRPNDEMTFTDLREPMLD